MGEMCKLSARGDDRVEWDPKDPASVQAAREKFQNALKAGGSAFTIETVAGAGGLKSEKRGRRLDAFDLTAAKIILVPQLQGG